MQMKYHVKNKHFLICFISTLIILSCSGATFAISPINIFDSNNTNNDLKHQASKIILDGLSSESPQIRGNAIETAAGTANRQFMPAIVKLTKDDLVPIKFAAAVAIGDTKYSTAKNNISELLKDNDENVRLAACYCFYMLNGSKSYIQQLRANINDDNQQIRANSIFLLGKIADKKDLPLFYQALRNENSDDRTRLNAIEAIARLGDTKIYQKIWAMLISAYADDRVFGIRAMASLRNNQAKDAISTMLNDELLEVRLVAAEQLGSLGDKSGEKVVIDALTQGISKAPDRETKARIQTLAALAIGQIRTPALKKFLPELLKSESTFARLAASKAIFQCDTNNNIGQ